MIKIKLKGKVALVTGGYKGAGRGIVDIFIKYGAKVIVLDYDNEVTSMNNDNIIASHVDIRNINEVRTAIDEALEKLSSIDIVVNNAGVCKLVSFMDMTDEERDYHFDINIKGTWNVTKCALPYLKENSTIINMSSVTGPMVADPEVQAKSVNFDDVEEIKERKIYIPKMIHPWKGKSFEEFIKTQKHRIENVT